MATTTGTLVSKVSSTASSPTVHYSATYTSTRTNATTKAVSVEVTFSGWLNSSSSSLGSGIKLTVYARMNGGSWSSAVLKSTSASWRGTTKHTAKITLSGNITSSSTKIDFYVTRSGSTHSGTAGTLGSSSSPKSYTATLPAYTEPTYRVTYTTSGNIPSGYTPPTDSTAYTSGTTVNVKSVPSVSGYAFNGWLLNGTKTTSFTINANTTLTGVWTKIPTYTVTYSVSGDVPNGYSAPIDSNSYIAGSTVTVKRAASWTGYTFNGWLLNGTKVTDGYTFTINANTTITGVWNKIPTYKVTYSVSGDVPNGYSAPTDSANYTSGSTVTVKAVPSATGYTFNGWLKNGTKVTSFTITANTTLTGVWTATQKYVYLKVSGVWKKCIVKRKINGAWVNTEPKIKVGGTWKST